MSQFRSSYSDHFQVVPRYCDNCWAQRGDKLLYSAQNAIRYVINGSLKASEQLTVYIQAQRVTDQ